MEMIHISQIYLSLFVFTQTLMLNQIRCMSLSGHNLKIWIVLDPQVGMVLFFPILVGAEGLLNFFLQFLSLKRHNGKCKISTELENRRNCNDLNITKLISFP